MMNEESTGPSRNPVYLFFQRLSQVRYFVHFVSNYSKILFNWILSYNEYHLNVVKHINWLIGIIVYSYFIRAFILQIYQGLLDKWTPHTKVRWGSAGLLVILFLLRVFLCQGWYIVTYALGIYHLNLFIAFLTPKIDPALDLDGKSFNKVLNKNNQTNNFTIISC